MLAAQSGHCAPAVENTTATAPRRWRAEDVLPTSDDDLRRDVQNIYLHVLRWMFQRRVTHASDSVNPYRVILDDAYFTIPRACSKHRVALVAAAKLLGTRLIFMSTNSIAFVNEHKTSVFDNAGTVADLALVLYNHLVGETSYPVWAPAPAPGSESAPVYEGVYADADEWPVCGKGAQHPNRCLKEVTGAENCPLARNATDGCAFGPIEPPRDRPYTVMCGFDYESAAHAAVYASFGSILRRVRAG